MKKIMYASLTALIITLSGFAIATTWKVKEPYQVKFSGGPISGEFKGLKATIIFDKAHPEEGKISATIDVTTLSTGFFLKTNHAKDALDAEKYPSISFTSTTVAKSGNAYDANGKLTMKGVTKPVTIHFTFDDKGNEGTFNGSFKVMTKDFNITRSGSPDEMEVSLLVPVSK